MNIVNTNLKIELSPTPEGAWEWKVLELNSTGAFVSTGYSGEAKMVYDATVAANWAALEITHARRGNARLETFIRETRVRAEKVDTAKRKLTTLWKRATS